jgi:hypothetical protein
MPPPDESGRPKRGDGQLTPERRDVALLDENWEPCTYQEADLVGITAFTAYSYCTAFTMLIFTALHAG